MTESDWVKRRLKFDEAGNFDLSYRSIDVRDELRDVVKAYRHNMDRVYALWQVPNNLASTLYKTANVQSHPQHGATVSTPPPETEDFALAQREVYEANKLQQRFPNGIDYGSDCLNRAFHLALQSSTNASQDQYVIGCEGILSAMITGTWTAFEVLAKDLWIEALNTCPQILAKLDGQQQLKERNRSDDDKTNNRIVRLNEIHRHQYDLSHAMGHILQSKFSFSSHTGIAKAYECAFGKKSPEIRQALNSGAIRALALTRNLLVHKGGIVDEEFKQKTKGGIDELEHLGNIVINKPIDINGAFVRCLLGNSVRHSIALVNSVHQWLLANTESQT